MRDVAVHDPVRPDSRAKRPSLRIDAADARNEPVSMGQVKARIAAQRHDGGRRASGADARHDAEHAIVVHQRIVVRGGHGKAPVEVLAFDPVLKLAGRITGVVADLEHGDHDDFHRDANGRRCLR